MKQIVAIVKHIIKDCRLFKWSTTVEKILKEITTYRAKINDLGERVKECIDASPDEYRTTSPELSAEALKIKKEILNSDMCQKLYSKLYIRHHLGDMSILDDDAPLQLSDILSESDVSSITRETVGMFDMVQNLREQCEQRQRECEDTINEGDAILNQYKKQIEELKLEIIKNTNQLEEVKHIVQLDKDLPSIIYNHFKGANVKLDDKF